MSKLYVIHYTRINDCILFLLFRCCYLPQLTAASPFRRLRRDDSSPATEGPSRDSSAIRAIDHQVGPWSTVSTDSSGTEQPPIAKVSPVFVLFVYFISISWLCRLIANGDVQQSATRCDFESQDLCGWVQDTRADEFDWAWRNDNGTSSFHLGTGPSFDHTLGEGKAG
jgi:hypothetical protein